LVSGVLIYESGDIGKLPWKSIVDVVKSPESIGFFYASLEDKLKTDPRLNPLIYSQGEVKSVISKPFHNHILAVFGVSPNNLTNIEKATWAYNFKKRISSTVESVLSSMDACVGVTSPQ
jgi:hypothetical protein